MAGTASLSLQQLPGCSTESSSLWSAQLQYMLSFSVRGHGIQVILCQLCPKLTS